MGNDIQRDELLDVIAYRVGRECAAAMRGHLDRLTVERDEARIEADRLRRGLRWYANKAHWVSHTAQDPVGPSALRTTLQVRWLGGGDEDVGHGREYASALLGEEEGE